MNFDIKGYLVPYKRTKITIEKFEEMFVEGFDEKSSRVVIFKNYLKYIDDFKTEITPNFTQWINGSYVTSKLNPRDIDFVTLINHDIYRKKRDIIDSRYRLKHAKKLYSVDAYTLEIFPEGHKNYGFSKIDLVYWDSWFSKTKKNRDKKTFPKGYNEIEY